jgi:MinD superfamily P-loop ATPase
MVESLGLPMGIVLNRYQGEEKGRELLEYVEGKGIELLAKIPLKRSIAETISNGGLLVEDDNEIKVIFRDLLDRIIKHGGK